jgi:hypothetical protein
MITRRAFLRSSALVLTSVSLNAGSVTGNSQQPDVKLKKHLGPLSQPDVNGVMLPDGFTSRVIARSGLKPHVESPYRWHDAPDGGATFETDSGGWIYVSNSEMPRHHGGAGAIEFDAEANVISAYPILERTNLNCAGGATPWGTWLSCEEFERGVVWECDPHGKEKARSVPTLGRFTHEAVAVDTQTMNLYLTEDRSDGCLYRFVPSALNQQGVPDLTDGQLQVAIVDWSAKQVRWQPITDVNAYTRPIRYQVASSAKFNGGEGIVYYEGAVSFVTKGDNRVWAYNTETEQISVIYDVRTHANPILTGVDNIALSQDGQLLIGEDGGNMQLVAVTDDGDLLAVAQLAGHRFSEITGPAFSPDGKHLYFSSQRGTRGTAGDGITFEISGPFHQ